jgi:ABC-type sugar transport system permease subunit
VLIPIGVTFYYSLLRWNGIGVMQFRGLQNYITVLTEPDLLTTIGNAFQLVLYFSVLPVGIGLGVAQVIRSDAHRHLLLRTLNATKHPLANGDEWIDITDPGEVEAFNTIYWPKVRP